MIKAGLEEGCWWWSWKVKDGLEEEWRWVWIVDDGLEEDFRCWIVEDGLERLKMVLKKVEVCVENVEDCFERF